MQEAGIEVEALRNRPTLAVYLQYHWEVFWELSERDRPVGVTGVRPIPLTAFIQYADFYSIPVSERVDIWSTVKTIDQIYVGIVREKQAAEDAKAALKAKTTTTSKTVA